jgi:hypothetical protein
MGFESQCTHVTTLAAFGRPAAMESLLLYARTIASSWFPSFAMFIDPKRVRFDDGDREKRSRTPRRK